MKFEFEAGKITIQLEADRWGPYTFDFEEGLPAGRTLSSVSVKSYLGRVKPKDSDVLSNFTETTSELIDEAVLLSDYVVSVYFDRPSSADYINQKHSLVFEVTMDASGGGGTHTAFYYQVEVL
jgi:hypothetical protein